MSFGVWEDGKLLTEVQDTLVIIPGRQYDEFFQPNELEERCADIVGNNGSGIWERNQKRSFGFEQW